MGDPTNIINFYAFLCLLIAILFFIVNQTYNWQITVWNWGIILLYLFLFCLEQIFMGIPSTMTAHPYYLSKGALLQFLGGILPYLYCGIRIFLVIPLILTIKSSNRLKKIRTLHAYSS